MSPRILFLGGTRHSQPLDSTSARKFRLLAQLGENFVIGFSKDLKLRRFTEHAHFYLFLRWPLPVLRYLTMFIVGPWLALWLIWRRGVRVLVVQSPYEGFAAAWAKIMARWLGRRVAIVVENHGDFEASLFMQRRIRLPRLYRFLMRRAARFALKHADVLRAVSNTARAQLERWAPGKPILQFPTWTDIEVFSEAGAEREGLEAGSLESEDRGQEIVYVGVLIPRKGVQFLLDAFAQVTREFPEARLSLIGKAENAGYAQSLKDQVARLDLNGHVAFLDAMPQSELAEKIAAARVMALPSLSEGLPRVVFEAMACGTPVIGSRVDGIPEMIEEGVTGFLVPPGDGTALAERLRWVLRHPEEAAQMGQKAREFAQRFFSPQAYQENYARLFAAADDILQRKGTEHAPSSL